MEQEQRAKLQQVAGTQQQPALTKRPKLEADSQQTNSTVNAPFAYPVQVGQEAKTEENGVVDQNQLMQMMSQTLARDRRAEQFECCVNKILNALMRSHHVD